jgi:hypothetical protein
MPQASFRFYSELNDFLPAQRRQVSFCCRFDTGQSVKHLVEALGVPHPEVGLILVNGKSVGWGYLVKEGDRVSVYPILVSIDIASLVQLQPQPWHGPCFVLDAHLGRLAVYLRMLGFDTLYRNDYADEELARVSSDEKRILLTRDRGLLKRGLVTQGYCLRETDPLAQLAEVVRRFDLTRRATPYWRCLRCNGELTPVDKEAIWNRVSERTRQYYHEFRICTGCDRIYWRGSHVEHMQRLIEHALAQFDPGSQSAARGSE